MRTLVLLALAPRLCAGAQRTPEGYTFSDGGSRVFRWECHPGSTVEWRLAAVNADRPGLAIEVYNHGSTPPWDRMAGRLAVTGPTTATVAACPHATLQHPQLGLAMQVLARYGPAPCTDRVHELHVTATGPYVFVLGPPPRPTATALLTWEHAREGWRFGLPGGLTGFVASVFFVLVLRSVSATVNSAAPSKGAPKRSYWQEAKHIFAGKATGVAAHWWEVEELAVVLAWTSGITADASRYLLTFKPPACTLTHGTAASALPDWVEHAPAAAAGIALLRVGVGLTGIACVLGAGLASRRPDNGIWVVVTATAGLVLLSLWYAVGFAVAPLLTLVWVVHSTRKWTKAYGPARRSASAPWQWVLAWPKS